MYIWELERQCTYIWERVLHIITGMTDTCAHNFFTGIFKCMYSTRDCVKVSQPAMLSNVHVGVHGNRLPQLFLAAPQSSSGGG